MDWQLVVVSGSSFLGGFLGVFACCWLKDAVMKPLKNRREHKRLLDKERFKNEWGGNWLAFFLKHDGFRRG